MRWFRAAGLTVSAAGWAMAADDPYLWLEEIESAQTVFVDSVVDELQRLATRKPREAAPIAPAEPSVPPPSQPARRRARSASAEKSLAPA